MNCFLPAFTQSFANLSLSGSSSPKSKSLPTIHQSQSFSPFPLSYSSAASSPQITSKHSHPSGRPFHPLYFLSHLSYPYDSLPDSLRFQYEFSCPLTKQWLSNVIKKKWFIGAGTLQITEIIEFEKGACVCLSDAMLMEKGILLGNDTKNLQEFDVIHVLDWTVESDFMWEGVIWRGDVIVCREWRRLGKGGVRFGEPVGRLKRRNSKRKSAPLSSTGTPSELNNQPGDSDSSDTST